MKLAVIAAMMMTAGALLVMHPSATNAQPEVTYRFPEDGDVLAEPPPVLRMCFAEPVNFQDLDKGGDFAFSVLKPDERGLGLRIVFLPDGMGVDVLPGLPEEVLEGEWTFEWRVTDPDTLEPSSGTVRFTVDADGEPLPEELPVVCGDSAAPVPQQSPTPAGDGLEAPPLGGQDGDDGGLGTLPLVLIIAGSVAGAVVAGLLIYRVRGRARSGGPRPPGADSEGGGPGR